MVKVKFITDNFEGDFKEGKAVVEICKGNDLSLPFGCTHGNCGTCLIKIRNGNFSPKNSQEKITLGLMGLDENKEFRLACQCKVSSSDVEFESGY